MKGIPRAGNLDLKNLFGNALSLSLCFKDTCNVKQEIAQINILNISIILYLI